MTNTPNSVVARNVPAKNLSPPTTVSPELQASMSQMAAASAGAGAASAWVPGTPAEWKAIIAHLDGQVLATLPFVASLFPHTMVRREIAGVTVREVTPARLDPTKENLLLVHFHGGGYALNGGEASTIEAVIAAHHCGLRVISVDYRMPPDHPFPAAVEDAVNVWRALTAERPSTAMGAFGTSAGGGLTLAMTLQLRELGLPLPAARLPPLVARLPHPASRRATTLSAISRAGLHSARSDL
jgi:acetyl esterase/lipase